MTGPAGVSLPLDFSNALCARLSSVPDLRLPAAMCRDQAVAPTADSINAYLTGLLQRDPAVFLERYSSMLSKQDLEEFQSLRDNYEVNYWLTQAEQHQAAEGTSAEQQQSRGRSKACSKTVANRRLAYMHQLEQQGEYFSEDQMRAREPLVWHEYIGQFEGQPPPPSKPSFSAEGFAGSLLAAHDEALIRARLQQQLDEEECQRSEHESDSEADDSQQQQEPSAQQVQQDDQQMQDATADSARHCSRPQQQHRQQGIQQQQADMSVGAMRQRRQEFLEEMQSRFLLGLDGEHQQYAVIDADVSLDDAWAAQQAQDAEDAYFDAD